MIINSTQASNTVSHVSPLKMNIASPNNTSSPTVTDRVSISDAALSLQSREQTDAKNLGQWEAAFANHRTGTPQLVRVDSAIAGGINDTQSKLRQTLASNGIDPKASFSLSYDAANQTYRVDGAPDVKTLLEAELNGTKNSATAGAIREGYSLLDNMTSSLAGLHEQFALDHSAGAHTVSSRQGYAYPFSLGMIDGVLSAPTTSRI